MQQSRSGQALEHAHLVYPQNLPAEHHSNSLSTQFNKHAYLNSLRTIQETKSPDEQQSLANEVPAYSHNTIQLYSNCNTVQPSIGNNYNGFNGVSRQMPQAVSRQDENGAACSTQIETQQDVGGFFHPHHYAPAFPLYEGLTYDSNANRSHAEGGRHYERVLDNLSQMKDLDSKYHLANQTRHHAGLRQKSYNNDDIEDVAPKFEEQQPAYEVNETAYMGSHRGATHPAPSKGTSFQASAPAASHGLQVPLPPNPPKRTSDNASVMTNTNTVTTYMTNNLAAHAHHPPIASRRTAVTSDYTPVT